MSTLTVDLILVSTTGTRQELSDPDKAWMDGDDPFLGLTSLSMFIGCKTVYTPTPPRINP